MLWRDTKSLKNITLYVFLKIIRGTKFCLQLSTDDLTWRIIFQGNWKKCENEIFFKRFSFLNIIGISKLVSILQKFTIKSKDQNFQAFSIFGFFLPFLLYILLAETQDKNNGKQNLQGYND